MQNSVPVEKITEGSPASSAGLLEGDMIISINGHSVSDIIDYMFYKNEDSLEIKIKRDSRTHTVRLVPDEGKDLGVSLRHFKVKTCRNKCIFCFVSQLPRGLRKSLYVKDEDYRSSFLYGSYITLTNLSEDDKKRIIKQRLSPIYISVHTTDRVLRGRMLGNPKAPDILKELEFFSKNRIRMHVQIVLCPAINDADVLKKTIGDLCGFYPYVSSIAVVPVGLTAHRELALKPVEKPDAEAAINAIEKFRQRFRKKHGDPIAYASDELYIKAERPMPPLGEYGELSQIENGVGMVPLFMSTAKKIKHPLPQTGKKYLTFTGSSFYPYLKRFTERLKKEGIDITPIRIENNFFGKSVTVAGLLTGRDIVHALSDKVKGHDMLLMPDCAVRDAKDMLLDNITPKHIEEALGIKVKIIESTPEGLIKALEA